MKRPSLSKWFAAAASASMVLLQGCAGPGPSVPAPQAKAIELNHQAMEQLERGEPAHAASLFRQALALSRAAEDEHGIALNLLNLSQAHAAMGNDAEAEQALDGILQERRLTFAPHYRLEAMLRKSVLALQRADTPAATQWLDQADALCGANCAMVGKILNLRARLALDLKQNEAALAAAHSALAHGRRTDDRVEIANALRLQGAAQLALQQPAMAEPVLQEALAIDKALATSDKIFQDLLLLGHTQLRASEAARNYWSRARDVARASGNAKALRDIEALLTR